MAGGLKYHLRCSIFAHSSDIRAITAAYHPVGGIVTGSRDRSIKVWSPSSHSAGFYEAHSMHGASHYISSLCSLPASDQYPHGLILAGSNDCSIYGFSLDSPDPVLKLLGHSDNVCALVAGNFGTVVSGSWDKTARVWFGQKCVCILSGHSEAVWAVAVFPDHNLVLTGSADKSIRLWRNDQCERKFVGHEDCVRGLAIISDSEFLSCSNDTTIRLWKTSGMCVRVCTGHTDYIYGISLSPCREYFVSCSEDQAIKIWKENECVQTIKLPATTLWAVTFMSNSDIAVGGSDGTVRVFTTCESRKASAVEQATFEEEVTKNFVMEKQTIGALEVNDVPGMEALLQDGTEEGQTQLCKHGNEVFVFQWSVEERVWVKLGKVTDAQESKPSKGKTVYEGKEYDHVFTIDVAEGKLLKLPYNNSDNPWQTAQEFIVKNNLNPVFLQQIVEFIVKNSNHTSRQALSKPQFSDPFTGDNRYIPSNMKRPQLPSESGDSVDSLQISSVEVDARRGGSEVYFPLHTYITFDTANANGIKSKLCEFTEKVERMQRLSDEEIECMLLLSNFPNEVTDSQMLSLEKALSWPKDMVFPALDVLRLAVRAEPVNSRVSKDGGTGLINHLLRLLSNGNPVANQMLVLRTFSNFFVQPSGEQLLVDNAAKILELSNSFCSSDHKYVQIALSTLYVNYAVAFRKLDKPENDCYEEMCFHLAISALKQFSEPEAILRLLACIGTVIQETRCLQSARTVGLGDIVKSVIERCNEPKVQQCGTMLISLVMAGVQ